MDSIYHKLEDIIEYEKNYYGYVPSITEALRIYEKENGRFTDYGEENAAREYLEDYFEVQEFEEVERG
jgi:hypothetical protein